jgi:predicted membrane metal-binding protein
MSASTHEDFSRKHEVKGGSDRSFGLVFAAFFAIIGLWPLVRHGEIRLWSLALAVAFLAVALAAPRLLALPNRLWIRFGLLLSRIVNPVIMGLVFFLAVTPTAAILKLTGKDPLRLRLDREAKSYWIERKPPGPAPDTMTHQF